MKRIAIEGTHGVGKTTLARCLINSFKDLSVTLNSQIARSLIENGYPLGKEATAASYVQYIIAQLRAEEQAKECDLFISDRTLLDPLAYAMVNQESLGSDVPDSIIELLKSAWLLELRQYDLYVFVPIEFAAQADGVRPEGEPYRKEVEKQMLSLLNSNNLNYITVSGSIAKRTNQVREAVYCLMQE